MNNVDKLTELRRLAIERGFDRLLDISFYIPVRERTDGRRYIMNNADHALLFDPDWMEKLVGSELVKTGLIDASTLEEETLPAYIEAILTMARLRAEKGDVIGYVYNRVISNK